MSEMAPERPPRTPDKVARDLTEITALYHQLPDQAINDSDNPHIPGGRAMIALGPVANQEAWENLNQATERYGRAYTWEDLEDEDDAWPAFQLIAYWAAEWRRERDWETEKKPTMESEIAFIRYSLEWAWDNEPAWHRAAGDINKARLKLEDVLFAGTRAERTRIVCDTCDSAPRLLILRGSRDDGSEDTWKCPACKRRLDSDDLRRAHAKMLRSEGAERWLHQADAIGLLRMQGRSDRTVRQWLAEGEGDGYCDPLTHEVWVWWPSLWRKHLMTPTRKRSTA